jgi:hypothetical protein
MKAVGFGDLLLLGFFFAWLWFGLQNLYGLAFELCGTESLVVSGAQVKLTRSIGRFGYHATYPVTEVTDLRVLDTPPIVRGIHYGRSLNGRVALQTGTRVERFGDFLDFREGARVLELLRERGVGTGRATGAA